MQYGRGISSIAEQIKSHDGSVTKQDKEEAKKLSDDFFRHYPKAKEWMEGNYKKAREIGYVEDLWGRRRHLPDASLPKYTFEFKSDKNQTVNPLLGTADREFKPNMALIDKYKRELDFSRSREARDAICAKAEKDGLKITCNSGFIAQAERQAINAPIQGGSATMTKLAMRDMYRDKELNDLDFHLLIPVHDELIAEAPLWNIEKAKKRMEYIMIHAGEPECKIPMKCDADSFYRWYEDVFNAHAKEEYNAEIEKGLSSEEAIDVVWNTNSEFTREEIKSAIFG